MKLVKIIFKFMKGKKNLIKPKGINKQERTTVFITRIDIDNNPIKFSNKNFTLISLFS